MVGVRSPDEQILYPVSELAARYGASAEEETPDPDVAYAGFGGVQPGRPPYWDAFPWASPMRAVVAGARSIGPLLAAHLAQAADVTALTRPAAPPPPPRARGLRGPRRRA